MLDNSGTDRILTIVIDILRSRGTEAVQLAEVAKRARVSLSTIYKNFDSRDGLILGAVEAWMATSVYPQLTERQPEEPVLEALVRQLREIFEPWERNPRMAEAFMRARLGPGGASLRVQGDLSTQRIRESLLGEFDETEAEEILTVLTNVITGLVYRFASGSVEVTGIIPIVELTLRRLIVPAMTRFPVDGRSR